MWRWYECSDLKLHPVSLIFTCLMCLRVWFDQIWPTTNAWNACNFMQKVYEQLKVWSCERKTHTHENTPKPTNRACLIPKPCCGCWRDLPVWTAMFPVYLSRQRGSTTTLSERISCWSPDGFHAPRSQRSSRETPQTCCFSLLHRRARQLKIPFSLIWRYTEMSVVYQLCLGLEEWAETVRRDNADVDVA